MDLKLNKIDYKGEKVMLYQYQRKNIVAPDAVILFATKDALNVLKYK